MKEGGDNHVEALLPGRHVHVGGWIDNGDHTAFLSVPGHLRRCLDTGDLGSIPALPPTSCVTWEMRQAPQL